MKLNGRACHPGARLACWVIILWGFGVAGDAISVFFGDRKVQESEG